MKRIEGAVDLMRVIWLEPSDSEERTTLEEISVDDLVQRLIRRDAVHQQAYADISPHLEAFASGDDVSGAWRRALQTSLKKVQRYQLFYSRDRLPEAMDVLETIPAA